MDISAAKRSLRLRASAEAFEVLQVGGSPKIKNAELLKHAVRSDHEPHPRVVREVHQALLEARAAQPKERTSPLKKISGVFSRKAQPERPALDDVVRRFEQAFVRTD
ncbi:MAG: hypothetical protein ACM369_16145 [Acidobacteriota bacterium]